MNPVLGAAVRHSAARAAGICAASVAGSATVLALPAALGHTLDLLLGAGDAADARRWTLLCAALVTAAVLLDAAETLLTGTTDARATARLRHRIADRIVRAGPPAAARFGAGDLVARTTANAADAGTAPSAAASALAAVVTPVGALVALALVEPWLAVVFLAGAPVLALLLRAFARASSDSFVRYQRAQGLIAARFVEALGGARTIAAAGTTDHEARRVLAPLPELSAQGHRMWRVQGRTAAQAAVLVPLLQTAVVAVGGLLLAAGRLGVGELLAAARYATLATGIGMVTGRLAALVRARAAADRLSEVLDEPPTAYGGERLPDGAPGTLELRGITVARGGTAVLRDLDLTLPGGATVAVVGRSGAGKSLLAAVAGRLADPDSGEVRLDGVALPELSHDALRREVGYAFERPALVGGDTIGDVIAYGAQRPSDARIMEAAEAACADRFVALLPDGYGTPRADAPLSGGEVQRLGLARAFAHAGRLLILDDATSSLDSVTELRVARALTDHRRLRSGTRLIIAHRASTAARADLVAWLDDGRIRALGPHTELWSSDPAYREVFADA